MHYIKKNDLEPIWDCSIAFHLGISLQGSHFSAHCHKSLTHAIKSLYESVPVTVAEEWLEMQIKCAMKTEELEDKGKIRKFFCKLYDCYPFYEFLKHGFLSACDCQYTELCFSLYFHIPGLSVKTKYNLCFWAEGFPLPSSYFRSLVLIKRILYMAIFFDLSMAQHGLPVCFLFHH